MQSIAAAAWSVAKASRGKTFPAQAQHSTHPASAPSLGLAPVCHTHHSQSRRSTGVDPAESWDGSLKKLLSKAMQTLPKVFLIAAKSLLNVPQSSRMASICLQKESGTKNEYHVYSVLAFWVFWAYLTHRHDYCSWLEVLVLPEDVISKRSFPSRPR
jgi:hypothetical protein